MPIKMPSKKCSGCDWVNTAYVHGGDHNDAMVHTGEAIDKHYAEHGGLVHYRDQESANVMAHPAGGQDPEIIDKGRIYVGYHSSPGLWSPDGSTTLAGAHEDGPALANMLKDLGVHSGQQVIYPGCNGGTPTRDANGNFVPSNAQQICELTGAEVWAPAADNVSLEDVHDGDLIDDKRMIKDQGFLQRGDRGALIVSPEGEQLGFVTGQTVEQGEGKAYPQWAQGNYIIPANINRGGGLSPRGGIYPPQPGDPDGHVEDGHWKIFTPEETMPDGTFKCKGVTTLDDPLTKD